jgi:HPt (histidine-containing phosphotransfer) domain-containing protein
MTRAEKLRQLRDDFVRQVPGMLEALAASCDAGNYPEAHRRAHTLAGTAGTFGLDEVSVEARAVETYLDSSGPSADPIALGGLVARLNAAAARVRPPGA